MHLPSLVEQAKADAAKFANETPQQTIDRLTLDVQRAMLHNMALTFRMGELRSRVRYFVEGCGMSPIVSKRAGNERVIGFKDRLDDVMHVWKKPVPTMVTREEMAKAIADQEAADKARRDADADREQAQSQLATIERIEAEEGEERAAAEKARAAQAKDEEAARGSTDHHIAGVDDAGRL